MTKNRPTWEEFTDPRNDRDLFDSIPQLITYCWGTQHPTHEQFRHDPCRVVRIDYRPFDTKFIYYGSRRGLIGHPRWETMKHLVPWYFRFSREQLIQRLRQVSRSRLELMREVWDDYRPPLDMKFVARGNVLWALDCLLAEPAQLELF